MEYFVCIHCHFYQPPRENPWLEAVESQDSASPYHDWNERITAECYRPNGASRLLDGQRRIEKIVNNYARISFNFGPTLLSWMEERDPDSYERILRADCDSQQLFSGHGSALAQAYNHIILPLANSRDKQTQILWGIRDFQQRFGRDPEGMWLPETAVDLETLEILSALGIKFTILGPQQAGRMRANSNSPWTNLYGQGIDSRRAYIQKLPSGNSIGLFFYDSTVARAVAFDKLLYDGGNFARRLMGRFDPGGEPGQLLHIATDGETYGHHHIHGDMALAYALDYIENDKLARLSNYGEYFEQHPPTHEVEVLERTSWSCMHGVARWESHCGCNSMAHGDWNQHWRRPLRDALDWLRDDLAAPYEANARKFLRDPWVARDEYVELTIDRSLDSVHAFLIEHAVRGLTPEEEVQVLRLLEMQRHLMLMYTSCGWFFDEPTGPETIQIFQYAGRAVQLSEELCGEGREERFLKRLEAVHSNIAEFGNGRAIYERFVRTAMLDLFGVAAHYAISSLFDGYRQSNSVYSYDAELRDVKILEKDRTKLAIGRAAITSRITRAQLHFSFATLYFGDHNLSAGIRPADEQDGFQAFLDEATQAFSDLDSSDCLRIIDEYFRGATYSLKSLFQDERKRIISQIVNSTLADIDEVYLRVYNQHRALVSFLSEVQVPLPNILRVSAEFVLGNAIGRCLTQERLDFDYIRLLLDMARSGGLTLATSAVEPALRKRLEKLLGDWKQQPGDLKKLNALEALVTLAQVPPIKVDFWNAQNEYCELLQAVCDGKRLNDNQKWIERFRMLGEQLGISPSQLMQIPECACNEVALMGTPILEQPSSAA
jgi:alpha-amylase/alpha-mannosidase (GH57 family)